MRFVAALLLLNLAAVSSAQIEEAVALSSKPMNSAAIKRALYLTENGDLATRVVLSERWRTHAQSAETHLSRLERIGVPARPLFNANPQPTAEPASSAFTTSLIRCLSANAVSESPELRAVAFETLVRLAQMHLWLDQEWNFCGTVSDDALDYKASQAVVALAPARHQELLGYLKSSEPVLLYPAATLLASKYTKLVKSHCLEHMKAPNDRLRRVALYGFIDRGLSSPDMEHLLPFLNDRSRLTRAHIVMSLGSDPLAVAWLAKQPFPSLPAIGKLVIVQQGDPQVSEIALADADSDVVSAAINANPRSAANMAALRQIFSGPIDDVYQLPEAVEKVAWSCPSSELFAVIDSARSEWQGHVLRWGALRYKPGAMNRLVSLGDKLGPILSVQGMPGLPDGEVKKAKFEELLASANPHARLLAAQLIGFNRTAGSPATIRELLLGTHPGVITALWNHRNVLTSQEEVALVKRTFPGLDSSMQSRLLTELDFREDAAAVDLLTHFSRTDDPQLQEIAARMLARRS